MVGGALRFTGHLHPRPLLFGAGRTIRPFADGETKAGKMISLGVEPSLEISSVASEQGLEWMVVMGCMGRRGRRCFSFCLGFEAGHEPELQH